MPRSLFVVYSTETIFGRVSHHSTSAFSAGGNAVNELVQLLSSARLGGTCPYLFLPIHPAIQSTIWANDPSNHPSIYQGHQVCGGVGFMDVDVPRPPPLEAQFVYATLWAIKAQTAMWVVPPWGLGLWILCSRWIWCVALVLELVQGWLGMGSMVLRMGVLC